MKDPDKSVVQVFADTVTTNWKFPWIKSAAEKSGTGFCVLVNNKKHILTNAHCVNNSPYIRVRKQKTHMLFNAEIIAILYECDLALLTVKKAEFWSDMKTMKLGTLPVSTEKIYVVGYPLGGSNISISKGSVNRLTVTNYMNITSGIAIQIDAPINSGNSGGPVVNKKGLVVGVAFASENIKYAENMGYVIPVMLIQFFIQSILRGSFSTGKFTGLCFLDANVQPLYNEYIRKFVKISPVKTGVLVTQATAPLKSLDVLTGINNRPISNNGTMLIKDIVSAKPDSKAELDLVVKSNDVAPFRSFISLHHPGDKITLNILRGGRKKNVVVTLQPRVFNVAISEYQASPRYFIVLGMVFVPLTFMLIQALEEQGSFIRELVTAMENVKVGNEIVVLVDIFTTEFTEGFPSENFILHSANNIIIRSFDHFHKVITSQPENTNVVLRFRDTSHIAVINTSDINKYSKRIAQEHGISVLMM